mmetsp:Transcript_17099/g.24713  ORF Transcript_17099/g.24713 Transcript_17099/m.24713 type:complete len:142 (+) Transcript_17099:96-521(+)|eukprot:CAMPEP_0202449210 /NCGR_PEP_ID=MMETSP1360-20130828/7950_1 /ASSEMBLY_ACC=CAM_ASM_000848 /TAXON_ID=515479 /ORGANISM="Licmophora paradoxa, Strain CCMP2313" /LENGTH=141 /DNA_ID=CAMNT_0049067059 /DNA_START=96 /DNA_END=521 /DNA_ORIENTATION=-
MTSIETCESEFQAEVATYNLVVYISLGLTLLSYMVGVGCKESFIEKPALGFKIFGALSVIKLIIAILLFTSLTPTCPDGCRCSGSPPYFYAIIVTIVSFVWAMRAYTFYSLDQNAKSGGASSAGVASQQAIQLSGNQNSIV